VDEMDVSMADQLAGYVRKRLKAAARTVRAKSSAKRCGISKTRTSARCGWLSPPLRTHFHRPYWGADWRHSSTRACQHRGHRGR